TRHSIENRERPFMASSQTSAVAPNQEDALREWLQGNFPAYCARPVRTGDWLPRLAAMVDHARGLPPVDLPHPGPGGLWPHAYTFEIRPILYQPTLAAVVFYPRSEESAGLRQLWRWHRTGAHEAWFLESNCWKECDIAGLLAHRVLRKGAQV